MADRDEEPETLCVAERQRLDVDVGESAACCVAVRCSEGEPDAVAHAVAHADAAVPAADTVAQLDTDAHALDVMESDTDPLLLREAAPETVEHADGGAETLVQRLGVNEALVDAAGVDVTVAHAEPLLETVRVALNVPV